MNVELASALRRVKHADPAAYKAITARLDEQDWKVKGAISHIELLCSMLEHSRLRPGAIGLKIAQEARDWLQEAKP